MALASHENGVVELVSSCIELPVGGSGGKLERTITNTCFERGQGPIQKNKTSGSGARALWGRGSAAVLFFLLWLRAAACARLQKTVA